MRINADFQKGRRFLKAGYSPRSTGRTDGTLHLARNERAASRLNTEANATLCLVNGLNPNSSAKKN